MWNDDQPLQPGEHVRWVMSDDRSRAYHVHVPHNVSADPDRPAPVVLAFHGAGSTPDKMVGFCGLNDKANEAGFLVVYPSGSGRTKDYLTWNGGNCCGHAQHFNIDDVKFVSALLDDVSKVANVDERRIYAAGMSNGGVLAHRLGVELSDRIAAVASISGPLGLESCTPRRPISVLHFHGTDDLFAPYEGGKGKRSLSRTHFHSVAHTIECWVQANECPLPSRVDRITPRNEQGLPVTIETYGPGKAGSEVVLVTILGGGHTWPGRVPDNVLLGASTLEISANDLMWEFFERHPL